VDEATHATKQAAKQNARTGRGGGLGEGVLSGGGGGTEEGRASLGDAPRLESHAAVVCSALALVRRCFGRDAGGLVAASLTVSAPPPLTSFRTLFFPIAVDMPRSPSKPV
jgi:hypothetical protein